MLLVVCQNSRRRKSVFNVLCLTYGTFVKQRATSFQLFFRSGNIQKKSIGRLDSRCPLSYSKITLRASIASQILTTTGDVAVKLSEFRLRAEASRGSFHHCPA